MFGLVLNPATTVLDQIIGNPCKDLKKIFEIHIEIYKNDQEVK